MKRRFAIIFILGTLIGFVNSSTAQKMTFEGIVVDRDDPNYTLSFGSVDLIKESDTSMASVNFAGHFKFKNVSPGEYKIQIASGGYHTLDSAISINADLTQQIFKLSIDTAYDWAKHYGYDKDRAIADIKNNEIALFLPYSCGPLPWSSKDSAFEKKYQIKYVVNHDYAYAKEYISIISNYLDKKYGNKWRKEVRDDVIGIEK